MNEECTNIIPGCSVSSLALDAISDINPGFNIYQVGQLLPVPDDVLGFPYSDMYVAPGREIYFNRTDVKQAINAPLDVGWEVCASQSVFVSDTDTSDPSIIRAIPHVIERTNNVQIAHGTMDMVLLANTTLLAIQNMTWNGQLGFQTMPESPLFVPHHPNPDVAGTSGQGVLGTWHEERGLTWVFIELTGHMVPTWQAAVAFRQVEVLLGRVAGLANTTAFSIYANVSQPDPSTLGFGTAPPLGRAANTTTGFVTQSATKCKSKLSPMLSPAGTDQESSFPKCGGRGYVFLDPRYIHSCVIPSVLDE